MPVATLDGIATHYEIVGSGPPLVMFSPGGFDARLANWGSHGSWRRMRLIDELSAAYTCVLFDKRESGASSGRVERIAWGDYVAQGLDLMDTLGIDSAHLMGGCVGCTIALGLAIDHPERVRSLVLYSPAGGPRYRRKQLERFAAHAEFVAEVGLEGLARLLADTTATFSADPRVGPWSSVLRAEPPWLNTLHQRGLEHYLATVRATCRTLFAVDTVPGVDADDLAAVTAPTLVVPGHDDSHAPSAACYLQECLRNVRSWSDAGVEAQAPSIVIGFLQDVDASGAGG